jgi:hypothetical protein
VRDADLRRCLLQQLRASAGAALVVEELGLVHGEGRADIVAISAAGFHGYELKSERDSLRRLGLQVRYYGWVLDRCTLVAAPSHLAAALTVAPPWWGVKRVRTVSGQPLTLEQVREARPNTRQQPLGLACLLWREEVLALLRERGVARGARGLPRLALYRRLLTAVSMDELRVAVARKLRERHASGLWR